MKRFFISLSLFVFVFFAATLLTLYIQQSFRPVLLWTSLDDSIRPRNYCLMNPFRDKQPEVLAEKTLQELKNGNPDILFPLLKDLPTGDQNHFLENEKKYKVETWRIGDRTDSGNKVKLVYWVSRKDYFDGYLEEVSFFFTREENEWKLKEFGAIY